MWLALVFGIFGGLLAGLLGIGGGLIFIAVMPFMLAKVGVPQAILPAATIANSILGTFFSSTMAMLVHHRGGTRAYGTILIIGLPALATATLSLHYLVPQPWFSASVFNSIVLVLLTLLLARMIKSFLKPEAPVAAGQENKKPTFLATAGLFSGFVASVSGMGGGIIIVPVLRYYGQYALQKANAISSGTIVLTSLSAIISSILVSNQVHLPVPHFGYIVYEIVGPLVLGTLIGAPVGVRLSKGLPLRTITIINIFLLLLILGQKGYLLLYPN